MIVVVRVNNKPVLMMLQTLQNLQKLRSIVQAAVPLQCRGCTMAGIDHCNDCNCNVDAVLMRGRNGM